MPPRRRPPRAGALSDLPPLKILRNIILLQLAYHSIALILIVFTTFTFGQPFSVDLLFDWRSVRADNTLGWTFSFVWILVGFLSVIPLLLLISRSKLIPDFALTIHLIHLIITSLYVHAIPSNLLWWALQAVSALLMTAVGLWACRYREMQPISFGLPGKVDKGKARAEGDMVTNGSAGGPSYELVEQRDKEEGIT